MRVQIVDPAAYTPPYDHALSGALARAGAEIELVTARFPYGPVPVEAGYEVNEFFYRRGSREGIGPRRRRFIRAAEHVPDMLRYRRHAEEADIVHFQWLPIPALDRRLLPRRRPRVYTMHWRLPESGSRVGRSLRGLLAKMDAVVVHSEHGAERLRDDFGVPAGRLRVIPHGAFDYLTRQPDEQPLPEELREVKGPVILAFGLIRPYKGTDVLLRAFSRIRGAELWIVGMPRMPMDELRALAGRAPGRVRFIDRFIPDNEIPAFMRRADLVVLPYRNIEQSGVLYTALAFGRPLILSAVGGFSEIAERGGARLVPPEDPEALAEAMQELIVDRDTAATLAAAAAREAAEVSSWERIADQTVALYRDLT
jgi:glycosyltransferase involved in cell wall biosynthesis